MTIADIMGLICEAMELEADFEEISSDNDNDSGEIFLSTLDGDFVIRVNEA